MFYHNFLITLTFDKPSFALENRHKELLLTQVSASKSAATLDGFTLNALFSLRTRRFRHVPCRGHLNFT
jgi:hypothetical protein